MAPIESSKHVIEILCPSLSSELRLERGIVHERLGRLFEINLSLYSEDRDIDLDAVLGSPMAISVKSAAGERWFHGIVAQFAFVGISERHGHYQATLRPSLWLMGHVARCRVFRSVTLVIPTDA